MSKRCFVSLALSQVALLAAAVTAVAAPVATASPESARLATYARASGETYFALGLTPNVSAPAAASHDVVVLFDTSASQVGVYRDDALATLRTMLASMRGADRVQLIAVDLNAIPLTSGFVPARGPEMTQALAALERRVPLGTTDMAVAMKTAAQAFEGSAADGRAVVYLGDGVNYVGGIGPTEMAAMVESLTQRRAAVTSFAIGPRRDVALLGALANHTGGALVVDSNEISPQQAGAALARAADEVVIWPTSVTLPKEFSEVLPRTVPPLRGDRDTILIGQISGKNPVELKMSAMADGRPVEMAWTISPEKPSDDFAFVGQLVEMARADGGMSLPTVGSGGLREAQRVLLAGAQQLANLAGQAASSGNKSGAAQLADEAVRRDPTNSQAWTVLNAVQNRAPAGGDADLRLVNLQSGGEADGGSLLSAFEAEQGAFLDEIARQKQLQTSVIQAEVERGLTAARESQDPEGATRDLKLLMENVERAPDLDAEVRAQLRDRIVAAVKELQAAAFRREEEETRNRELEAAARERLRLVQEVERRQDKIKQIMARFNALMDEGRYALAVDAAEQAQALDPNGVQESAAVVSARLRSAYEQSVWVRQQRHIHFVDMIHQCELSAIPFNDNEPIVYPDPEFWEDLSIRRKKYASIDLAKTGSAEQKIFDALDETTTLEFIETPLREVVDFLKDLHGIEIQIDNKALAEVGLAQGADQPVTRNLKGVSLRSALRLMLKELDLTYIIKDEVLLITTPDEAESQLVTKVYPVADLVLPINSGAGANPFMLGGGLGGQGGFGGGLGGGMGGGFGGGGFGGGGFGGGGFGGGGLGGGGLGGGGFFNIRDQLQRGGAFAVEDELKLGAKVQPAVVPAPQQPVVPQVTKKAENLQPIVPTAAAGASAEEVWDRHFAQNSDESAAAVRETVRRLMYDKKFNDVIAVVQAAVRHGQLQPWMYETLGLAMQAVGASDEDVQRALLSAVDFSTGPTDALIVAVYLTQLGYDRRALEIFRSVSDSYPLQPEPYMQGLGAAQRLSNIDGIRWATVGILSQAWPNDQRTVESTAYRVAMATLEQLKAAGRTEEAEAYQKDLNQAMIRDCLVKVTWTGDADIDLLVEEPSGTVCSLRNPRTTAGGVMFGDAAAHLGQGTTEGYSEVYSCPKGFTGEYRMLIRRVWGRPAAGTVTVDIFTNHYTNQQSQIHRQLPLNDKDTVVIFNVNNGRRTEDIAAQQLANVVKVQEAVGRAVLAQQLNTVSDSQSVTQFELARRMALRNGLLGPNFRGAVGYRPVITTLPEGANMTATAVISADRRYVRITAVPLFSQVGDVSTFNFVTGSTANGATPPPPAPPPAATAGPPPFRGGP